MKQSIDFPGSEDAESIKVIQDSWLGTRVGSEGFLLSPESLERLREMIASRNVLVARRESEIVAYITFYRRVEWEALHPSYTANLNYNTADLGDSYRDRDYVVIDHIARRRDYSGDASVRLVLRLKRMLREWGIGEFLGEISPENERSAAFFTKSLRATRIGTTVRDDVPWDIYAAQV